MSDMAIYRQSTKEAGQAPLLAPLQSGIVWTDLAIARKEGWRISIGTDSHAPSQLEFMELGIAASPSSIQKESSTYMSMAKLMKWSRSIRDR